MSIVTVITPKADGEFRQNHVKSRHLIPIAFKPQTENLQERIGQHTAQEKRT